MRNAISLTLATFLVVFMIGCGNSGTETKSSHSGKAFDASFDVVLENETKKYDPMNLEVEGDHGTISVTNTLDAVHGFVISEFDIDAEIKPGETREFTVDSVEPGEYTVDCDLHSAHAEATVTVK